MWIIVFFAPPLSKRSEQNLPYKQSDTASSWWQLTPTLVVTPFFISFFLAALLTFKTVLVSYHENIAPSSNLTFALKSKLSNTTLFMFDLASFIGLTAPNVFNKEDVDAANLFAFIEKKNIKNGKWSLVPFIGYDGSRLALHGSDIFRYRISIPVRRCLQVSSFPECKHLLHPVLNIYNKIENKNKYLYRIVVIDKLKNHIEKYSL